VIALLLGLALAAEPAPAPDNARWVHVRTPFLEIVTDAGAARASEGAARAVRFRAVLAQVAPVPLLDTSEAIALAVADGAAYRALRPRRDGRAYEVDGFVQGGALGPVMALHPDTGGADPWRILDHESVHLALNGALPAQPLWVSEGLAELYSDWSEGPDGVSLGALRPEHVRLLVTRPLIPITRVLAAGYTSPEFQGEDTRPLLYAESWALMRLVLNGGTPAGSRALLAYLRGLAEGVPADDAFAGAFGWSVSEAGPRLLRSLGQGPPPLRATAPPPAPAAAVEPSPPGAVEAMIGRLLIGQERETEARRHFQAALEEDPDLPAAHEGLAALAARHGEWAAARRALDAARRQRPDDPVLLCRAAELAVREGLASPEGLTAATERAAADLAERAVARAPRLADAVDLLARLRPEPRHLRIRQLRAALLVNPGRPDLAFTLAGLYVSAQEPAAAAAVLRRARDTARDETYRFLAEHMLGRLGQATANTIEASGRWRALECLPGGALDFLVDADPASLVGGLGVVMRGRGRRAAPGPLALRLRAPTPGAVLLQDAEGNLLQPQLTCGPQSSAVRVRYRLAELPGAAAGPSTGILMTMRLLERPAALSPSPPSTGN